jgi:cytochrome bd-type quinol oxidase subunit 2
LRWYNAILVFALEAAALVLAVLFVDSEFARGCIIYGTLGLFGILVPGLLAFWINRIVGFPTLFFTIAKLRHRLHFVAVVLVAGLAILAVHLAFYPWPDLLRESTRFAGLTSYQARVKAQQTLRTLRAGKPPLQYSTQERTVVDGHDAWLAYFRATSGPTPCVVTVTDDSADASPECTS